MLEKLKDYDFFSDPVYIGIQGRKNFSTSFGGIITMFVLSGLIPMTWFFGTGWIQKKQPQNYKSSNDISLDNNINFHLNKTFLFEISKGLIDNLVPFFQLNYLNQYNNSLWENHLYMPLSNMSCRDSDFQYFNVTANLSLNDYFCFDTNKLALLRYGWDLYSGPIAFSPYAYLQMLECNGYKLLYPDQYKANKILCKNYKIPNLVKYSIFYDINSIDESLLKMFTPLIKTLNSTVNTTLFQSIATVIGYDFSKVSDDIGALVSELVNSSGLSTNHIINRAESGVNGIYFSFNFQILTQSYVYYYTRRFQKLPELLASVGGFFNISSIFIKFFYSFFRQFKLQQYLAIKIFETHTDFTTFQSKPQNASSNTTEGKNELISLTVYTKNNQNLNLNFKSPVIIKNTINISKTSETQKIIKMLFTGKMFIRYKLGCGSKNKVSYRLYENFIDKFLSIENIIETKKENIKRFKVLFDHNQLNLIKSYELDVIKEASPQILKENEIRELLSLPDSSIKINYKLRELFNLK